MQMEVLCSKKDVVKCCHCSHISSIENLKFVDFYSLPEPGGKSSPTGHYHCVCGKYLAYQQAEGRIVLSNPKYVEIVES